jgi:YcxB-like protein/Type II secretion system (T2SS), protein G
VIIQYQSKKTDIISFYGYYYFIKRISTLNIAWLVFGGLIGIGTDLHNLDASPATKRFLFGAFIAYIILFIVPFLKALLKLAKLKNEYPKNNKISVIERGMTIESNNFYRLVKWLDIVNTGKTNRSIFFVYDNNQFIVIPKKAFPSFNEMEVFLTATKKNIVKPKVIYFKNSSGSHLYNRGWWELIPFIGAFVGLGLLILGIFEYKDKKLALIGAAGILFTVLIYTAISFAGPSTEEQRVTDKNFCQADLNNLVEDIEYYKIQNGAYPDSLEELPANGKAIMIYDPLMVYKFGPTTTKYNYKKIGEKYAVFSSGYDYKPNTKDDIYPDVVITDSNKIGLIRDVEH